MLAQAAAAAAAHVGLGATLNNGRYRVNRRLNKGATAVVYAGEDLFTGRAVALKVVQCGSNKVPVNVVRREVTLSSSVAHENMVSLLDVFAEGTELVIVWELIAGGDLLELLNECNGCMTEAAAAFYYVQLLRGVLYMHAMGYCHRDIKPENCMIERHTQRLKLCDFGLSKHLESVATLGVGTPDYMPPEMVKSQIKQQQQQQQPLGDHGQRQQPGLPPYDAKAVDAWAMGVVLYLLVTGSYPFEDPKQPNNLAATILNVQAGRCQPLPGHISAGCRAVIAGLLCPDPTRRTRLEELSINPWLLQSAAAHAARLGPLGAQFDAANPAWILPTPLLNPGGSLHLAAAAATAATAAGPRRPAVPPASVAPAFAAAEQGRQVGGPGDVSQWQAGAGPGTSGGASHGPHALLPGGGPRQQQALVPGGAAQQASLSTCSAVRSGPQPSSAVSQWHSITYAASAPHTKDAFAPEALSGRMASSSTSAATAAAEPPAVTAAGPFGKAPSKQLHRDGGALAAAGCSVPQAWHASSQAPSSLEAGGRVGHQAACSGGCRGGRPGACCCCGDDDDTAMDVDQQQPAAPRAVGPNGPGTGRSSSWQATGGDSRERRAGFQWLHSLMRARPM